MNKNAIKLSKIFKSKVSKYPAIKICFRKDIKYNIYCIKKLIKLNQNNIEFGTNYKGLTVKYILSNTNLEIISALKALEIKNKKEQYTFIYNNLCQQLDDIWSEKNPCNFCNNICIVNRERLASFTENGCCYSFNYSKGFVNLVDDTTPVKTCKYIEPQKGCTTKNLPCKIFACKFVTKKFNFKINTKNLLLFEAFFNSKQKLILKYNFFKSDTEIIEKLLEKNNMPYLIYRLRMKFIIV